MFPGVSELTDIELDGDKLSFKWDAGTYGIIEAKTILDGDQMNGVMVAQGAEMALSGVRKEREAVAVSLSGVYDLRIQAPQGTMDATLELEDGEELTGAFQAGDTPLTIANPQKDGSKLTFYFDTPDFGRINARANFDGETVSGTMNAQGTDVPFTGRKKAVGAGEAEVRVLFSERAEKSDY